MVLNHPLFGLKLDKNMEELKIKYFRATSEENKDIFIDAKAWMVT